MPVLAEAAGLIAADQAVAAGAARHDDLQGDAVADLDSPPLGGAVAELLDDAHRLVARD